VVEGLKVIVGAGRTSQPGWHSLEESELDIRRAVDWLKHFQPASLDVILAEHVLEHLELREAALAVRNCYAMLRPGGRLRIAVPDGLHPDPRYIDWVMPGGIWNPDDHKALYDYRSLSALLNGAGFMVHLLEWYDEGGSFRRDQWGADGGDVWRCRDSLYSRLLLSPIVGAAYTSLIVDGVKPV